MASASSSWSQPAPDSAYKWRVLATVVISLFMVVLDATVVNVALKALELRFTVGTSEVQAVISLYSLALGIATPLSGFLGDRFGIKRVFLAGLGLFALGSLLCGLAGDLTLLLIARGIQGVGGGVAAPLGTALLFRAFPPRERGVAFGIFGIVIVCAPAVGPLLGGWLVDHNLLAWIFFLNVPIGALGLALGTRFLKEAPGSAGIRTDVPGIILATLGFGAVLFAASLAGEQGVGWGDTRVLVWLIIGIVSLLALVFVELRTAEPLLDLQLFRIPSFALATLSGTVGTIALFAGEFLLPLYLQLLRGQSALQTGLLLLPLALAAAVSGFAGGLITDRIGPRVPIVVGFLLIAYNTFALSQIRLDTSLGYIVFLLVLRGFAVGLVIQNTQVAALLRVPPSRLNRATPLLQAMEQTMQSIGVALLATILSSAVTIVLPVAKGFSPSLLARFQAQYITGFERAYLTIFIISLITTALSLFLPGWPGKYELASLQEDDHDPTSDTTDEDSVYHGMPVSGIPEDTYHA